MALTAEAEIRLQLACELIRAGVPAKDVAGQVKQIRVAFDGVDLEDNTPREFSDQDQDALPQLGASVESELHESSHPA